MANLPPIKRFVLDDFNGITVIQAFASKLFYPLNLFLNATYSAFANGITLSANTIGSVTQATNIKADANGLATTTINWPFPQSPPQGVAVLSCSQSSTAALYPIISWAYSAGVISISMQFVKASSGSLVVAPSGTYSLVFWASGG